LNSGAGLDEDPVVPGYPARVIPHHDGVVILLEAARILWQR